ncbi:hypothetical protein [Dyella japonica]|uniref:hypothetical protein n=1 Tax=Dyella japonica TaxID=231455 RepID=UPI000ADA57E6|nr:hypothetical protein [Dyella japonica]
MNNRQFDRRFWKVLAVTLAQILLLLAVTLTLVHLLFGHSPLSEFLFQVTPVLFTGLGIKMTMDRLRKSGSG